MTTKSEYLGDAVYATLDQHIKGGIILTTDSHRESEANNIIYLEPLVIANLLKFLQETQDAQT